MRKRRRLSRRALDYLRLLKNPPVKIRFDIVEVLLAEGKVREMRHLPNTFRDGEAVSLRLKNRLRPAGKAGRRLP